MRPTVFRRWFRMRRELFRRIVQTLEARVEHFQQRHDAACKVELSPLTKCTVALPQLAYGTTADMFDEYLHVGDTTGRECQAKFCAGVVDAFGAIYLRKPTAVDCQVLMEMHERMYDFPGMLGSIDCMRWEWKNCPTAWRGQFTSGYKDSHPTMIFEAIVDHRLCICHAHFGMAGSNSDINVLNTSSLFTEQCNSKVRISRSLPTEGIIIWVLLSQWHIPDDNLMPNGSKVSFFAQWQEYARKDV